ncbi:ankyrin repeat-containing domain protein [Trichophaea hybrida]|nr:ankyrin repeat-containing domain protein [Trichophaea hybrida]
MLLDRGVDIEVTDNNGYLAFYIAIREGREAAVRFLLDCGANINANDGSSRAALYLAAKHSHTAIVELFLSLGLDIELPGGYYSSPLQATTLGVYKEAAERLLTAGANVLSKNSYGWTPLLCASLSRDTGIRELFTEHLNSLSLSISTENPQRWSDVHKHPSLRLENRGIDVLYESPSESDDNGTALHAIAQANHPSAENSYFEVTILQNAFQETRPQ